MTPLTPHLKNPNYTDCQTSPQNIMISYHTKKSFMVSQYHRDDLVLTVLMPEINHMQTDTRMTPADVSNTVYN